MTSHGVELIDPKRYKYGFIWRNSNRKEIFPPDISKTARNELRKIRATHENNVSVALIAAGGLIPTIGVMPKYVPWALSHSNKDNTEPLPADITVPMVIGAISYVFGRYRKRRAEAILTNLED